MTFRNSNNSDKTNIYCDKSNNTNAIRRNNKNLIFETYLHGNLPWAYNENGVFGTHLMISSL